MPRVAGRNKRVSSLVVATMMLMLLGGLLVLVATSSPRKTNRIASSSVHATVEETIGHTLLRNNAYSLDRLQDDLQKQQQQRKLRTTGGVPGDGLPLAVANFDGFDAEVSDSPPETAEADERQHKNFLPLDRWDYATLVLATLGLMIAAAGGIGGGGILVPLYILVLGFSPKHAVPLSSITIFGGAITNAYLNMRKRHPVADRPMVDWDLILIMEPLMIGGALVGSFIQKVLPEMLLTFMMILLLLTIADRTLRKGIKTFKKESARNKEAEALRKLNLVGGATVTDVRLLGEGASLKAEPLLGEAAKALSSYGAADAAENGDEPTNGNSNRFRSALLAVELEENGTVVPVADADNTVDNGNKPGDATGASSPETGLLVQTNDSGEMTPILPTPASNSPRSGPAASGDDRVTLKDLLDQERNTNFTKVGIMTAVFTVVLAIDLLKGGGGFKSPLGIECGSFAFWSVTLLAFVWVMGVSLGVRQYLVNRWNIKSKLGYTYADGDVEWSPVNTLRYPGICFFAGFFAGMFGVGGGMVNGPLMLEMGVHPRVASSTSAVMILYTSFTATTSFLVFGLLRMDYALPLFTVGLVATAFGQWGTEYLVKKFQRPSFIILSIGAVVALSAVLMGYNGVGELLTAAHDGGAADGGGGLCSAEL